MRTSINDQLTSPYQGRRHQKSKILGVIYTIIKASSQDWHHLLAHPPYVLGQICGLGHQMALVGTGLGIVTLQRGRGIPVW